MRSPLAGIISGPVTPYKSNDTVDFETFAKQIEFLVESGVAAIAHPMHIGESENLLPGERRDLAKVLVDCVGGRIPTFVHTSAGGTRIAAEMAEHAAKVNSTGIVLSAPYYWRSEPSQIVKHFVTVTAAHGGDLIAYNSPDALGVTLTVDICRRLAEHIPGFVGMKDGTYHMGSFTDLCRFSAEEAPHVSIFAGLEHLLPSTAVGGRGCFSACSEVAPNLVRCLWTACEAGDLQVARALQYDVGLLLKLMMRNYPSTIKYAMELMGRPVGPPRAPLVILDEKERGIVERALSEFRALSGEPRGWKPDRQAALLHAAV